MFATLPLARIVIRLARVWVVLGMVGGVVAAGQTGCTTTVTGKVYSPLGPTSGDPIPNILVYIPQTAVLPFSTTVGAGVTGGCSAQANLVSGNPLVNATTDAAGNFTLTATGLTTGTYNVVIQAGKWRRQYPNTMITACTANNIDTQYNGGLTMPATTATTDGTIADLPHIAVVTGSADGIECIFEQIGISSKEITDPTGTGSINFYTGVTGAGEYISTSTPKEAALVGVPATLDNYDVVIFGCQGSTAEADATPTNQENMVNYANQGGRIFATHYGYNWLYNISPFSSSADWDVAAEKQPSGTYAATIDQTYAEGVILAQWLQNIGASYNGVQGQIALSSVRTDTTGVNNPPAQNWVTLNADPSEFPGTPSMQFTFNTPVGSTGVPTVAITYTNTTTLFQPGDTADSIVVNVTNSSTAAATNTLVLTIAMPGSLTANSAVDPLGAVAGWTCGIAGLGSSVTCTRTTPLAAGASDNVNITFSIASTANVGQSTITASLSGGNISSTGQCGRVLYNDYHVEQTSGNALYPAKCSTGLTPQERFLEFSLYNLSNFIAPTSTDVILIQGTPTITWAMPPAIPYGTALTATQLDATASYGGTALAGTFVYTPPAGTVMTQLGTNNLSVTFTPTNTTDYLSATGSTTIQVIADTTSVVVTSGTNPSYLGQSVTFSAAVSTDGAIATGQTVNFFDGLSQIGTGTTNAVGVAAYTTSALIVGNHSITACVVASADFNASCSVSLVQLVTLIPTPPLTTTTALTSNANPSFVGQSVTFTAGVATTGAFSVVPTGTVTFYDGTTALGTGMLNASGYATFTTSTLALGTHTITAVYPLTGSLNTSTSNVVLQLVLTTLPSAGTGYLLTVSPINVSLAVGTSQVLNVAVIGLNNFQQTVKLTCTGTIPDGGCVLGVTTTPVGGGVTTLTLTAAAPHACGSSVNDFTARNGLYRGGGALLAFGGFGLGLFLARRRRRLLGGLTLAVALCLLPMMTLLGGCSGACTELGTQPGAYTLTVTAVSSGSPAVGVTPASPSVTQTQQIVVNVHL